MSNDDIALPVAAIICLSVGGYIALVFIVIVIRHILVKEGYCKPNYCSAEAGTCCLCCVRLNEACPCCCSPNAEGCLAAVCGHRKKIHLGDILLCNCCGCTEGFCEGCFEQYGRQTSSIPTTGILP